MNRILCCAVYVLCCFAVNAQTLGVDECFYDYRVHDRLVTNQLSSVGDLANRYIEDQYQYLWVAPPAPEIPLYQHGQTIALLDYKGFDYEFLTGLVPEEKNGIRTYPVWVYERESDSSVVIANRNGKELVVFDREKGYSPDWFVYNELFDFSEKKQDQQDWLKACYDPTRIVMKYDLVVGEDDLVAYVWSSSQSQLLEASAVIMPMRSSSTVSNLQFSSVESLSNGVVELTVEWPIGQLSSNRLDFFVCTNLSDKVWFVEDTETVNTATNVYSWQDYNSTNDSSRYYSCWTLYDTDNDGISDGRETLLYGTSPTNSDTDLDYMTDYEEITAGLNPNDA